MSVEDSHGANGGPPGTRSRATPGLVELSQQIASARGHDTNGTGASSGATPPPLSMSPAPPTEHVWLRHLSDALHWTGGALARPPVRLAVTGVVLLLLAAGVLPSSVWTLPLAIVGVLMVLIAWVGSRLRGHFTIEWGESGTQLDFRAEVASAGQRQPPPDSLADRRQTIQRRSSTMASASRRS